ncbi:TnpV protein [Enterocloster clostridioformis]|nr:TnpV protein [Enterocloster clostridioformis]
MEVTYTRKGDYLFPNLTLQEEPVVIGKYGMLRRTYLKEHKKNLYQSLLMSGKLDSHLQEIERTAQERMENLTENLLKTYPAPNKEAEPMKWTAHMNSLTQMAEETVLTELVYS